MPPGQKSKRRAGDQHHRDRAETQAGQSAQAATSKEEGATTSPSSASEDAPSTFSRCF